MNLFNVRNKNMKLFGALKIKCLNLKNLKALLEINLNTCLVCITKLHKS